MEHINSTYKVNEYVIYDTLHEYGFHKTVNDEIVNRFVVCRYNRKPLIFCDFIYDEEEKQIHIITKDANGNFYSYNKEEYGKSDVVEQINREIQNRLNIMFKEGIIRK